MSETAATAEKPSTPYELDDAIVHAAAFARPPARVWQRVHLDKVIHVRRNNGCCADGRCVDASEEGFGIAVDLPLQIGELVHLTLDRTAEKLDFTARVMWRAGARVGLQCLREVESNTCPNCRE
jgi:hypothetical protein